MKLYSKCHFIIVTDLHLWHKNIANRKNYVKECVYSIGELEKLIKKLKARNDGYKIYIIFLGDVFHRSVPSPELYNSWIQRITALRALVNGIFSVVGNHELSFAEDNPFWGLCNEIKSEKMRRKGVVSKGSLPIVTIPDHIDVFNTRLHFNHFGTILDNISPETNILLSHEYWATPRIVEQMAIKLDDQLIKKYTKANKIDDNSVIKFFKYCFFGHNHLLYGKYQIDWEDNTFEDTILYYLGSIGLTKRDEVQKLSSERMFPVLTITEEGCSVEEHKIKLLHEHEEVLDKQSIAVAEEVKRDKKELESLVQDIVIDGTDPLEKLREEYVKFPEVLEVFSALEEGRIPEWIQKYMIY